MGFVALGFGIIALAYFLYRYMPVLGVKPLDIDEWTEDVVLLDARDYQTSSRDRVEGAYCIPLSYLNRHYQDLPDQEIVLIVRDQVEKNLSTRLLRKKGFHVVGYTLACDTFDQHVPCVSGK
ncbi:sulfurtransferase [Halobacillus litoralis]|uniref:rhodanese-like domain-containing protein n=1 Tax=Halobacillus litoralis TaxID=45668 RepID=UPI001CD1F3F6|nr:rhodanese-like domain-containing protein [Halobacillus litoralis]MCA0971288.1 sulfurtransferase [Halobacillus litoralis]